MANAKGATFGNTSIIVVKLPGATFATIADSDVVFWNPRPGADRWVVQCDPVDAIDDSRKCQAIKDRLIVIVDTKGTASVYLGHENRRGSSVAIRINDGTAVTGDAPGWTGAVAQRLITQIGTARKIVIRYQEPADPDATTTELAGGGNRLAMEYLKYAVRHGVDTGIPLAEEDRPPTTTTAPTWNTVTSWSGDGSYTTKTTETFSVPEEWRIVWNVSGPHASFMGIVAHGDAEADRYKALASGEGPRSDTTYVRGAGHYRLEITAVGKWNVSVQARR
jgi:hypothetical protein